MQNSTHISIVYFRGSRYAGTGGSKILDHHEKMGCSGSYFVNSKNCYCCQMLENDLGQKATFVARVGVGPTIFVVDTVVIKVHYK